MLRAWLHRVALRSRKLSDLKAKGVKTEHEIKRKQGSTEAEKDGRSV